MKRLIHTTLLLGFSFYLFAQGPQSWTSADIYLGIKKLNILGSVLYIAAHPDDENTRLIAYFSKEKLYRTGYLSMTRGDGGQNLIGDEQGIELGLIRTQELLAARRVDGGEQFFTRAYDFGFSKSPIETFTKWDKEKILSDVVWVIRKFQPDVIITRFPTTGEGGHGHHTASAILANDAFTAAADPNRFPEQFKYGVQPWQPKRILWNSFNFGGTNLTSNDQFKFDVGGYNPLLGKSYGEIAAESRSNHKSQGFGSAAGRGEAMEFFRTTGGEAPVNDLFDGINTSWQRVKGGETIEKIVDSIVSSFDFLHPERSVGRLVKLYTTLNNLPDSYWKNKKLSEVKTLIEQCSGLFIDATTTNQFAVQSDSIRVNFFLNNRLGADIKLKDIVFDNFDTLLSKPLDKNKNLVFGKTFVVPASKSVTNPYWLKESMQEGYFNVSEQTKIGQPNPDDAYKVKVNLVIEGTEFSFDKTVKYKFTDPVRGELYQPVFVIPAMTVLTSPGLVLFKDEQKEEKEIIIQANANKNINQKLKVELNASDTLLFQTDAVPYSKYQSRSYSFVVNNFSRNRDIKENKSSRQKMDSIMKIAKEKNPNFKTVSFPERGPDRKFTYYGFVHEGDSSNYYLGIRSINYDHIPSIKYFYPDAINVVQLSLKTYGKKIGYIVGAGDKVPEALEQMGYEVTLLGNKELSRNNLQQFDAIITGVRAYNTNEWMNTYYDKLMKYVEDGGNLIIQYNTSNFISNVKARMVPYPLTINRNRITDENAQVRILNPEHPAFNFPNKILDDDFKGWIQERSIYHATDSSGKFEKLISMTDPGENPDDGSLLVAKYGKGYLTYTGLVFFRELPAGVPGAYRLLANLIALNRKKAF
jgi:LmbE family N-acetylglucosaminyl deacetylase